MDVASGSGAKEFLRPPRTKPRTRSVDDLVEKLEEQNRLVKYCIINLSLNGNFVPGEYTSRFYVYLYLYVYVCAYLFFAT